MSIDEAQNILTVLQHLLPRVVGVIRRHTITSRDENDDWRARWTTTRHLLFSTDGPKNLFFQRVMTGPLKMIDTKLENKKRGVVSLASRKVRGEVLNIFPLILTIKN